ncbi:XdhC family protein [Escherichia coli]|uniref:XdhC family protein n=1 Tax=Escherichia coli TaxID=562 RepID=UPI003D80B017
MRGGAAARSGRRWWCRRWSLLRFVSGGCVEAAAAFEALEMMGSGCDREIRYGEGSPCLTSFCLRRWDHADAP